MAADRTIVTELCTALGMLGYERVRAGALDRSRRLALDDATWDRLGALLDDPGHDAAATAAFANGAGFLASNGGLGGRVPRTIVWSAGRRPPGDEVVPADLLVDHVYLVSCKYRSKVLHNAAPSRLFDDHLMTIDRRRRSDWYVEVAPLESQELYARTVDALGLGGVPERVDALTPADRKVLKESLRPHSRSELSDGTRDAYAALVRQVSEGSADRWRRGLGSAERRERMVWRLLRIYGAPYFIVGHDGANPVRARIATPWDWRQRYSLRALDIVPGNAGQPQVDWFAEVEDRDADDVMVVEGHVEVRWSHGRFAQPPEAKVYLDTAHHLVPGYEPLD
ncbi:MAG: hypothetical protein AAGA17_00885 [Actinomycetota bacterium]